MEELIAVNMDNQTVSARELHKEVGSTERFSAWFERQLQFGFIENEDYTGCKTFNTLAHQELQDYNLSVDMAKQICMVQKNEKAREIRQYLIDLEKAWNTPEQIMSRALKIADQTIDSLKNQISDMKPKADYFDALVDKKLNTGVRDTANELGIKEREFVAFLLKNKYVYRKGSKGELRAYAQYGESGSGLFVLRDAQNKNSGWAGQQMYITPKGKETFRLLLENEIEERNQYVENRI